MRVASLLVAGAVGCGGTVAPPAHPEPEPAHPKHTLPPPEPVHPDAVLRARTTFAGRRQSDGATLDQTAVLDAVAAADLICVGEHHDDPAHHFVQLAVVEHVLSRAPQTGRKVGVGLEMLPSAVQPLLDDFAASRISEEAFLRGVDWERSWGYDFSLYRPIIRSALDGAATLLALNADRSTVRSVARDGLDALSEETRARLPELVLDDAEHRSHFDLAMKQHPNVDMDADHLYAAQVLWDETMADRAAAWLRDGETPRQLVVLAGAGHCHESAIVRRVERRVSIDAVSVRSVLDGQASDPDAPAVDYELVLDAPPPAPEP